MTRLADGFVVLLAVALGIYLHGLDIEPKGVTEERASGGDRGILGSAEGFSFRHVRPETGAVEWEASGALAIPESERVWTIERPAFAFYDTGGGPAPDPPTRITAEHGRASFPRAAEGVLTLERGVLLRHGTWRVETEEIVATLPEKGAGGERKGRLLSDRPVTLAQDEPEVRLHGAGLRADAALGEATLLPPVEVVLDPAALTRTARPGGKDRLFFTTGAPVEVHRRGETAADLVFTGAAEGRFVRPPPAPPFLCVLPRGGVVRLRMPEGGSKAPVAVTGVAESAEFHDVELREAGTLAGRGRTLTWSAERETATLEGGALIRNPARGSTLEADRMEYGLRPDSSSHATLLGSVRALLEGPTFTATLRAREAEVEFAPAEGGGIAPGPLQRVHARGDVAGEVSPVTRTSEAPRDERSAILESEWRFEGDDLRIETAAGGREVGALALAGTGRQALLESRARDPERNYRIEGARIEADRTEGRAAVLPAEGSVSRQVLVRGHSRLTAREIRYDEREGGARASGEVILRRLAPSGELAFEAQAAEARHHFAAPERPEHFELGGPGGALIHVVPELLTASATTTERHPLELRAARIVGFFADRRGSPELSEVRAESGAGMAVVVTPAFEAAPEERFRLEAETAIYEGASGTVRFEGAPPVLTRGEDEFFTAPEVRFDTATLGGTLGGGFKGRLRLRPPGAEEASLFSLEGREARIALARPEGRGAKGLEAIDAIDAAGGVRFHDVESDRYDLFADRLEYRRATRTVRLFGNPVHGHGTGPGGEGRQEVSGYEIEYVLPPPGEEKGVRK